MNLHTFYLTLEAWKKEKGHYPKKVYWQVDGGSENANKVTLAFCEYLVKETSIEEIYLTRLPVGHTHEDIDARFGTIWDFCRLRYRDIQTLYCHAPVSLSSLFTSLSLSLCFLVDPSIPLKSTRKGSSRRSPQVVQ